jgi:hypothetical protein
LLVAAGIRGAAGVSLFRLNRGAGKRRAGTECSVVAVALSLNSTGGGSGEAAEALRGAAAEAVLGGASSAAASAALSAGGGAIAVALAPSASDSKSGDSGGMLAFSSSSSLSASAFLRHRAARAISHVAFCAPHEFRTPTLGGNGRRTFRCARCAQGWRAGGGTAAHCERCTYVHRGRATGAALQLPRLCFADAAGGRGLPLSMRLNASALEHGFPYDIDVRAVTAAGHRAERASAGFLLDLTAPDVSEGVVLDMAVAAKSVATVRAVAPGCGADLVFDSVAQQWRHKAGPGLRNSHNCSYDLLATADTRHLSCHWASVIDGESGVAGYRWGIGSTPDKDDVVALRHTSFGAPTDSATWTFGADKETNLMSKSPALDASGLLIHGRTYYCIVEAINYAGLRARLASDGVLVDTTPPVMEYVHDGLQRGHDIDQQTFINSLFGNWRATDEESPIAEYEFMFTSTHDNSGSTALHNWTSASSLEMFGLIDRFDLEHGAVYCVCARGINAAGLRSAHMCSNGVSVGKAELFVPDEGDTGADAVVMFEPVPLSGDDGPVKPIDNTTTSDAADNGAADNDATNNAGLNRTGANEPPVTSIPESQTRNRAVLGALFAPPGSVTDSNTMLVAGVLSQNEIRNGTEDGNDSNSGDLEDPSGAVEKQQLQNNFRYGNYTFSIRAYERSNGTGTRTAVDNFTFAKPVRISVYYDVHRLLNTVNDDGFVANAQPVLMFYSTVKKRWMDAADTCSPRHVLIDEVRSQLHVSVCHLTQFAVFFQNKPKARIRSKNHVVFWPLTELEVDGSNSDDPDGDTLEFLWSVASSSSDAALTLLTPRASKTRVTGLTPGTVTLRLRVTDPHGGYDEAMVSVRVYARDIAVSVSPATAGSVVQLGDAKQNGTAIAEIDGMPLVNFWRLRLAEEADRRKIGAVTAVWELKEQPEGSRASIANVAALSTRVEGIARLGNYRFALKAAAAFAPGATNANNDTYTVDTCVHGLLTLLSHMRPVVHARALTRAVIPYETAIVELNSMGTYDPSGNDAALRFRWAVKAGPGAAVRGVVVENAARRTASATGVVPGGQFMFELSVTDERNETSTAVVTARICAENEALNGAVGARTLGSHTVQRQQLIHNTITGVWEKLHVMECSACVRCNPANAFYQDCDGVKARQCRPGSELPTNNKTNAITGRGIDDSDTWGSIFEDNDMQVFVAAGVLTLVAFGAVVWRRQTNLRKKAKADAAWHEGNMQMKQQLASGGQRRQEHHWGGNSKIMQRERVVCIACGRRPPAGALPKQLPQWGSGQVLDSVAWVCQHQRTDGFACGQHNAVMPVEARHPEHGMGNSLLRGWAYFPELLRDPKRFQHVARSGPVQAVGGGSDSGRNGRAAAQNPLHAHHHGSSVGQDASGGGGGEETGRHANMARPGAGSSAGGSRGSAAFATANPLLTADEVNNPALFAASQRSRIGAASAVANPLARARIAVRDMLRSSKMRGTDQQQRTETGGGGNDDGNSGVEASAAARASAPVEARARAADRTRESGHARARQLARAAHSSLNSQSERRKAREFALKNKKGWSVFGKKGDQTHPPPKGRGYNQDNPLFAGPGGGSLLKRVAALEKMLSSVSSGSGTILARVTALEQAVLGVTRPERALAHRIVALETQITQSNAHGEQGAGGGGGASGR